MEQKIYTTDEIILQAVKEKYDFETHKDDISYASHHKKAWLHVELDDLKKGWLHVNADELGLKNQLDKKTLTLSQLKKIVDKQLKVK